ncbi:MAG: AIR synthase related protein, partial [Pyrinomonadaceae bacterium]
MNEFDFINKIRALADERVTSSGLVHGIGDDAAVLKSSAGNNVVVTTDLLVEDVDFRRDTTQPHLLGHKALAVSLSDIAAMGARPLWALLSIGVPDDVWQSGFLDTFYEGFFQLAGRYGVGLIGGD